MAVITSGSPLDCQLIALVLVRCAHAHEGRSGYSGWDACQSAAERDAIQALVNGAQAAGQAEESSVVEVPSISASGA